MACTSGAWRPVAPSPRLRAISAGCYTPPVRGRTFLGFSWVALVVTAALGAGRDDGRAAVDPRPWLGEPFAADPRDLLIAANNLPAGGEGGAVILLDESERTLLDRGREVTRYRQVYRIIEASAVEGFSAVEAEWKPWFQDRPEIRARVISPDGAEHHLDPATIGESPVGEVDPTIFDDRRVLRAPLPAVAAGAVVETLIVVRDRVALAESGTVSYYFPGNNVAVDRYRLVIDAPAGVSLHLVNRLSPEVPVVREASDGRVRYRFEGGPLAAWEEPEPLLPPEVGPYPFVAYATGVTWAEVAGEYSRAIDARIAGSDLGPLAAKAVGDTADARIKASRLLALVHDRVRYTGVEFGEAAITPVTPAQALERRYGDCKDQATLLVALLRAVDLPAHVALLRVGARQDVEPGLPGLGAFDHAIVHVGLDPPLWIDPTDRWSRAGRLPLADEGRLALVASPATTGLVRTPESSSTDNRTVETRIFHLAEDGPARVVEISESHGATESELRSFYESGTEGELEQSLEQYAKSSYLADKLTRHEHTGARDFTQPFRIEVEVTGARRGLADGGTAVVVIPYFGLLGRLPDLDEESDAVDLPVEDAESSPEPAGEADVEDGAEASMPPTSNRVHDLVLDQPYVLEWRYRIVPPPGFVTRPLPEDEEESLGPAKLTRRYEVEADGTVTATLVFDTVKRRFTAAEARALAAGVEKVRNASPITLELEQRGQAALSAGQVGEALAEFRRLASLHPREALHHTQIAQALLAGGLGDAARVAAREAIRVEPRSALAASTLGWVLQHDVIGRRFAAGYDRPGSIAAYREAKKLDGKDLAVRATLAIVLEHDAHGQRYSARSDLAEAIREYQALQKDLDNHSMDQNLLVALGWAGRFDELIELAKQMPRTTARDANLVGAIAVRRGAEAAIREAARLRVDRDARRTILAGAGDWLKLLRFYPQAAALYDEAASGASDSATLRGAADLLRRTGKHEETKFAPDDPRGPVARLFASFAIDEPTGAYWREILSSELTGDARELEEIHRQLAHDRVAITRMGVPPAVAVDLLLAIMRLSVDGDPELGWRVRADSGGQAGVDSSIFLRREPSGPRIVAVDPRGVGEEVLRRLGAGRIDQARAWLDWAREEIVPGGGDDALSGQPFARLWSRGEQGDEARVRVAAASLIVTTSAAAKALPILEAARSHVPEADRVVIDLALAIGWSEADAGPELVDVAERLIAGAPDSAAAFQLATSALTLVRRFARVHEVAGARLERRPGDAAAIRAIASAYSLTGEFDRSMAEIQRLVRDGRAEAQDWNLLAWLTPFRGPVSEETVSAARTAAELTGHGLYPILHTLATIYAEAGHTSEARDVLLRTMALSGEDQPTASEWYVLGRLAEQYGERDAAIAAYGKVTAPEKAYMAAVSTHELAKRRLAAIAAEVRP